MMVQEEVSAMLVRFVKVVHEREYAVVVKANATTAVGKCIMALKIG